MAQKREPRKGKGVPREQPGGGLLDALAAAATAGGLGGEALRRAAGAAGFYAAGLLEQHELLARLLADACPGQGAGTGPDAGQTTGAGGAGSQARLLGALAASAHDQVRGLCAPVAYRWYAADPAAATAALYRAGTLPGTWARESAQASLKRLLINHGVAAVLPLVRHWAADPDPAARRLLVEALRPLGVWTGHLKELRRDPAPLHPILAQCLDDPSLYVRKAVANNLNDVGRDHPDLLCRWVAAWQARGAGAERRWVLQQGLRGLVRRGHPGAQALLGLAPPETLAAAWDDDLPAQVALNELIPITVWVQNPGAAPARVRVQVALAGPGRGRAPRVRRYLLGQATVDPGARVPVSGRVHFVDFNSQPRLPGTYHATVEVNGRPVGTRTFTYSP